MQFSLLLLISQLYNIIPFFSCICLLSFLFENVSLNVIIHMFVVSGISDVRGCGHRLFSAGVGIPGP